MEAGLDLQARDFSEVKANESAKRRPRVPLSNLNDFQAEFCIIVLFMSMTRWKLKFKYQKLGSHFES